MTQALPSMAIAGLVLRPATRDDWDAIASAMNRAHMADGVEEIQTGTELAADLEPLDSFVTERDMLLAEVDAQVVGFSCGIRVLRDGSLVGEAWGSGAP